MASMWEREEEEELEGEEEAEDATDEDAGEATVADGVPPVTIYIKINTQIREKAKRGGTGNLGGASNKESWEENRSAVKTKHRTIFGLSCKRTDFLLAACLGWALFHRVVLGGSSKVIALHHFVECTTR